MNTTGDSDEKENRNKTMLWTASDHVTITQDKYITCNNEGNWHQIGVNHTINQSNDIKTSWKIKIGSSSKVAIMIGIATKDIVSQKYAYSGCYKYGWVYHSNGYHYHYGKHTQTVNVNNKFPHVNTLKWAPNDEIKIEFCNYTLKLFIDDDEVNEWKMEQYPKLKEKKLIPVICINQVSKCEFLGVQQQ